MSRGEDGDFFLQSVAYLRARYAEVAGPVGVEDACTPQACHPPGVPPPRAVPGRCRPVGENPVTEGASAGALPGAPSATRWQPRPGLSDSLDRPS